MPPHAPKSALPPARGDEQEPESRVDAPERPNPFGGFALIMILLLLGGGLFLVTRLTADAKLQDCVMSGRKNCAPVDLPGSGR